MATQTLNASDARIPPSIFNRVAFKGEQVRIERRDGVAIYIISEEDMEALDALEDRYWNERADEALAEMKAKGEKPIPLSEIKKKYGLRH